MLLYHWIYTGLNHCCFCHDFLLAKEFCIDDVITISIRFIIKSSSVLFKTTKILTDKPQIFML